MVENNLLFNPMEILLPDENCSAAAFPAGECSLQVIKQQKAIPIIQECVLAIIWQFFFS